MNSKQLMINTLTNGKTDRIPVTPHWWGLYKFQQEGIVNGYHDEGNGWKLRGKELAEIDMNFYRKYKPDMFHLTTASPSNYNNNLYMEVAEYKSAALLVILIQCLMT